MGRAFPAWNFCFSARFSHGDRRRCTQGACLKPKTNASPPAKARPGILADRRNAKMARSAHGYMRGNTLKFYEWLGASSARVLPDGPPIWICGDCHVGNLGPVANLEGHV